MPRKIMVNLVAGLEGAGKTTLVRNLLHAQVRGERVAVIQNGEGAMRVAPEDLRAGAHVLLNLGPACACCEGAQGLTAALHEAIARHHPDRILIEATDRAEPSRILEALFAQDELAAGLAVEPPIAVVDVSTFQQRMAVQPFLLLAQFKACDVILLNKCDLADETTLLAVRRAIEEINPRAWIIPCSHCDAPLPFLFMGQVEPSLRDAQASEARPRERDPQGVICFSYVKPDVTLSRERLERALHRMPPDLFRLKGFVPTDDGMLLLNFVTGTYELEPVQTSSGLRLVFVGRDLRKDRIVSMIDRCLIAPTPSPVPAPNAADRGAAA